MDISPFSSEDDGDNNHIVIIKTKQEKTTHSKQDKVTAVTTGANVIAAKASILQKTEKKRAKAREKRKK